MTLLSQFLRVVLPTHGHKTLYKLDSKTLLGFQDFIPTNNVTDRTTWEDWCGNGGREP